MIGPNGVDNSEEFITILTVDDDESFQKSLAFTLRGIKILGMSIRHLQAYNYAEAAAVLSQNPGIEIAFFDVIMDTDDAGLRLVKTTREVLGLHTLRIVLLTGQPGIAPMQSLMTTFDINDYWTKTDLSSDRLRSVLISNHRAYLQVQEISRAKQGLQLIVASSDAIFASANYKDFSVRVLTEISKMLGDKCQDIVVVRSREGKLSDLVLVSGTGEYAKFLEQNLSALQDEALVDALQSCMREGRSEYYSNYACLFFADEVSRVDHAAYLRVSRRLDSTEEELLRVFASNISSGLRNVSLVSRLDHLAYEDELLQIPNKNTLLRILDQCMNRQGSDRFKLILLDINGFSGINTSLGSAFGDSLLKFVARILKSLFEHDARITVARIKDDLFGILGPKTDVALEKIREAMDLRQENEILIPHLNISTLSFPLEYAHMNALETLGCAQRELKALKRKGLEQHGVYNPQSDEITIHRFTLLQLLQEALKKNQISLVFQAQVMAESGKILGFEVLARWTNEAGTSVSPLEFIPLAETSGLIIPLGWQIVRQSCEALQALRSAGHKSLRMSVNFSALQFEEKGFTEKLLALLREYDIPCEAFELEATESAAMNNFEALGNLLDFLKAQGFHLAIDDFGTGFSSLSYLTKLRADRLKIDKSFVDGIPKDPNACSIVKTIINLAENVGMHTIAEGVETKDQLLWLKDNACEEIQGYYFSKPRNFEDFLAWLDQTKGFCRNE